MKFFCTLATKVSCSIQSESNYILPHQSFPESHQNIKDGYLQSLDLICRWNHMQVVTWLGKGVSELVLSSLRIYEGALAYME